MSITSILTGSLACTFVASASPFAAAPPAASRLKQRASIQSQVGSLSRAPAAVRPGNCGKKYVFWTARRATIFRPGGLCIISEAKYPSWLVFQRDGNLVHYGGSPTRAMWSSGTHGQGATRLAFQADGNVVMYRENVSIWHTDSWWYKRPKTTQFVMGMPIRAGGLVDQAKVVLVVDPKFRNNRPTFSGGKVVAWQSTSSLRRPPRLLLVRGKFKLPKFLLNQDTTKLIASLGNDLNQAANQLCGGSKYSPICKLALKPNIGWIVTSARKYYNEGNCLAVYPTPTPGGLIPMVPRRLPYSQSNCRELVAK